MRRLHRTRAARGFGMLEAVASLTLFAILSAVIGWSLTAAMTARAAYTTRAVVAEVVTAELAALTAAPTADLVTGTFTVPDPCPGTPQGISGQSCARRGSQSVTIAYRFTADAGAGTCPGPSVDPAAVLMAGQVLRVQACALATGSAAFADQEQVLLPGTAPQSSTVVVDEPGWVPSGRLVVVHVDGAGGDLGTREILLVDAADPTQVLAHAPVTGDVARLGLPGVGTDVACTPVRPCRVALSATPDPDRTSEGTPALVLVDQTRPGAPVTVADHATVHTRVRLSQVTP